MPQSKYRLFYLFIPILLLFLFISCKQPETVIIAEDPETAAGQEPASSDTLSAAQRADFRQLIVGEINQIQTLDPLFAENSSSRRAILQLFEGLVQYNSRGEVVPSIARRWNISGDSLTYRFTLRNDVFFHDSNIFSSGIGRKVVARDFKFVFERMAESAIPTNAAFIFMGIEGFNPYFREQHQVYLRQNRELEGVTGVQAPDDTTLVFKLVSKDPHFLQKLASPYGVVYPRQAVSGTAQNRGFSAVGTGPFKLSQQRGDSLYILVQNKKYRQKRVPAIDRLDIRVRRRESTLFKDLVEGDVHLIPEIGPATMQTVMDSTGLLRSQYRDRFTLDKTEALTYYEFIFYPESAYGLESVIWAMSKADKKGLLPGIPSGLKQINLNVEKNLPSPDTIESPLLTTYADDPFMRYFITQLTNQLQPAGVDLEMSRIRTPNINTAFFFTRHAPLYTGDPPPSISHTLADFSIRQTALRINELKNLSFNKYPWWIDLRRVELPGIDQLQ